MIHLSVITDGRAECLVETMVSAEANLSGPITSRTIIDDSANKLYGDWLENSFPRFNVVHSPERSGFAGALQRGWDNVPEAAKYVFWLEDDFTFNTTISLASMVYILETNPHLAQVALKRQPWNEAEIRAGGIVEMWPAEYQEKSEYHRVWTEHNLFFTTNPSLYRRDLLKRGWPQRDGSERVFTQRLLEDEPDTKFAFLGGKFDPPMVTHIGEHRIGIGY